MGKRRWLVAGGSVLAATIGLLGAGTAASASTASPVVGYTYIDGNTATANTIDGFARHADGSVTPLPGSPFAAGGAGLGSGLASQGAIQATPDGRYLLAVDAGSNQISVLRITAGGVPVPAGQPVSSGGIKPVSVAVSRSGLVYVANQGNGSSGSGYSGFRLGFGGTLTPIPGSTVTVPAPRAWVTCSSTPPATTWSAPGPAPRRSTVSWCCLAAACWPRRGPRSPARAWASSGRSSRRPVPGSCSSVTRTTARAWAPFPPTATASSAASPRSGPRRTPTGRPRRAGWRSATTAGTCSRSTPGRGTSPATPSTAAAHCP